MEFTQVFFQYLCDFSFEFRFVTHLDVYLVYNVRYGCDVIFFPPVAIQFSKLDIKKLSFPSLIWDVTLC